MSICTLPSPISLLTEPYHSKDIDTGKPASYTQSTLSSHSTTMDRPLETATKPDEEKRLLDPISSTPQVGQTTHLPSFKEFIKALPEEVGRSIYNSPPITGSSPTQLSNTLHTPRPTHVRTLSGRPHWHPYSPPASHRSNQRSTPSRTPSPAISEQSSNTDSNGQQPRSARPTYTEEEIYFIWYHRDDLGMGWNQVLEMFNNRFGKRERNGVQGIQCRYYRALEIHHVPKSRARDRSLPNEAYGVRQRASEKWWPWMHR